MSEAVYAVVFRGEICEGFSREQVQEGFARLFGLSADKLDQLFAHPKVVLKKGLSRDEADRYRDTLQGIGAVVSVEAPAQPQFATSAPGAGPAPLDPAAEAAVAASTAVTQIVTRTASAVVDPNAPTMIMPPSARNADETVVTQRPSPFAAQAAAAGVDHAAQTIVIARPPAAPQAAAGSAGVPPAGVGAPGRPAAQAEPRVLGFEFSGDGGEFFRIWIVNLLLSIVTLGIYSAWAKVRTQRYFYGNTRLDGSSFDYLGDPLKILKGRVIAFVLFMLYSGASNLSPILGLLALVLFIATLPWMIVRGLAFRNHNSAWRGVRFGFDGRYRDAALAFIGWPLLGALTLGLLLPLALQKQQRFIVGSSRYGTCRFDIDVGARPFYMMALGLVGIIVAGGVVSLVIGGVIPLLVPLFFIATYLLAFAYFNVKMTNLTYGNALLAGNRFEAAYELPGYARLMAVNLVGLVLTLGLFYPWAKVRNARYAAEHIALAAEGDLDGFVAARSAEVSATGGEVSDLFDVDLGL